MSLAPLSDDQVRHLLNNPATQPDAERELVKRGLIDDPVLKKTSKIPYYDPRRYERES